MNNVHRNNALEIIANHPQTLKAYNIAKAAHQFALPGGQKRKYDGQDYINHPLAVFGTLWPITRDIDLLCAALLHDVIEDTYVTIELIREEFNSEVADLVQSVSLPKFLKNLPHPFRKNWQNELCLLAVKQDPRVAILKLADIANNIEKAHEESINFAVSYVPTKFLFYRQIKTIPMTLQCSLSKSFEAFENVTGISLEAKLKYTICQKWKER